MFPHPEHTPYLALAMHSKVVSLDPATTLLLPGATTITGPMASWVPVSPVEKAKHPWNFPQSERWGDWGRTEARPCKTTLRGNSEPQGGGRAHAAPGPYRRACDGVWAQPVLSGATCHCWVQCAAAVSQGLGVFQNASFYLFIFPLI